MFKLYNFEFSSIAKYANMLLYISNGAIAWSPSQMVVCLGSFGRRANTNYLLQILCWLMLKFIFYFLSFRL